MASFDSLPDEPTPQLTDKVFTGRGTGVSAERKPLWSAILTLFRSTLDAAYAAATHSHPLSQITQSGATVGQVPAWNGTTYAPSTPASAGGGGDMLKASNLSDLASIPTAKANLGLNLVDNTPDALKPVSTAQGVAIGAKADTTTVNTALALKADASALSAKADTSAVNTALALKADVSALAAKADASATSTALATKVQIGSQPEEFGFGFDGGSSAITTGSRSGRIMGFAGTITGWAIAASDSTGAPLSGNVTIDIRKGTPSGGAVTTASITASATPSIFGAQVGSSSSLTGWTVAFAAGDYVEAVVLGSPTVNRATLVIKINR